jgi:hypothetical protein
MSKMIRVIPPAGCDEANYGVERFKPQSDGTMLVCVDALEGLLKTGGFRLAPDVDPAIAESASAFAAGKSPAEIAALISELETIEAKAPNAKA